MQFTIKKLSLMLVFMAAMCMQLAAQSGTFGIVGTHISILPIKGYKPATSFYGLQRDSVTGIQVYDYTNRNYFESIVGFDEAGLKAKGANIYSYKQLSIDGYNARYAVMQGDTGVKVATLLFGDSSFTAILVAAYAQNDVALEKQVEQSLLAAKYNKKAKVDPFALSAFKLNDANSTYKYAKNAGDNMYLYALNGEVKDSYMSESSLTAMAINSDSPLNAEELVKQVLEDMKKYGLNEAVTTYQSSKTINGYTAFELITYGNVAREKHAVYHMAVVKGNRGFIVQGVAVSDFETTIQQFEQLAHTVTAR
jgi:hypothetical protein